MWTTANPFAPRSLWFGPRRGGWPGRRHFAAASEVTLYRACGGFCFELVDLGDVGRDDGVMLLAGLLERIEGALNGVFDFSEGRSAVAHGLVERTGDDGCNLAGDGLGAVGRL